MSLVPLGPYVPPRARIDDRYPTALPSRGSGSLLRPAYDNANFPHMNHPNGTSMVFAGSSRNMPSHSRSAASSRPSYTELIGRRGSLETDVNAFYSHGAILDPRYRRATQHCPQTILRDDFRRQYGNHITVTTGHGHQHQHQHQLHDDYNHNCRCHECEALRTVVYKPSHEHHHCCSNNSTSNSKSSSSGSGESSSSSSSTSKGSGSGDKSKYSFPTKDIVVRGKSYPCRKSFLSDMPKFEDTLIKTLSSKKEDEIPTPVIESLFTCINDELCPSISPHDLVTLNILASSLGVKSVVEKSLEKLKKSVQDTIIGGSVLTGIVVTVMLSGKVDEGVKEWLKKYIKGWDLLGELEEWPMWRRAVDDHPEVRTGLYELLGFRKKVDDEGYRIL